MSTELRELLHNLLGDLMLVHELTTHERLKRVWRSGRIEYSKCWTKKTNAPGNVGLLLLPRLQRDRSRQARSDESTHAASIVLHRVSFAFAAS